MVEDMGGVFTGGHIANAQTWKETWSGKHEVADRVIIFVTPEYYQYFTAALKFEHDCIYEWATRGITETMSGNKGYYGDCVSTGITETYVR